MKYIASVSFGKDSLAMLLRLIEGKYPLDAVVFYNTGMEFDSIYVIRDKIIPILNELKIEYVELSPEEPFLYCAIEKKVKYRNKDGFHFGYGWCGGVCRWETRYKVQAISRFKESLGEATIDYVGIAADEPERVAKNKDAGKKYPLVDWNMAEADCLAYCRAKGFSWTETGVDGKRVDLYDVLDRVSCWCCQNKNLKELRNIYHFLPEYWNRLRDIQSRIDRPMKRGASVFDLEKRFNLEDRWICDGKQPAGKAFREQLSNLYQKSE